jgi:hypothetical protein
MPEFTTAERHLVKNIVATLSIKAIVGNNIKSRRIKLHRTWDFY